LVVVALLAFWFVLFALFFSGVQEGHAQGVLYTRLRPSLSQDTVAFGGKIKPGTPIALINSPALDLTRTVIVEGTTSKDLTSGPGHYPASPMPGQPGRSLLFGRSASYGGPFGKVSSLKPGDPITITTGQGTFGFQVVDVRAANQPQPSAAQIGYSSITLVTAKAGGWRSGWAGDQAIFADAKLMQGKIAAAPSGMPTVAAKANQPLKGDSQDLVPLVLWLQALLLLTAGLVYSVGRWSVWQLWLVGAPAVIAVLWGVSNSAMLLLPNLS
jgi:sortase A